MSGVIPCSLGTSPHNILLSGDTREARRLLETLASGGSVAAVDILSAADVLQNELGPLHSPMEVGAIGWLGTLGEHWTGLSSQLSQAVLGNPSLEAGISALILRARAPFASLATWPFEVLFSDAESDELRATRPSQMTVTVPGAVARLGQPINYAGQVSVILKATRRCNLRCGYCSDWRDAGRAMDFSVYRAIFEGLIASGRWSRIDFIWHGGEPTLIGRHAFLRMLAVQQFYSRPGQTIGNSMQTNGVTMTRRLANLLAHLGINVSVSLDGVGAVHDKRRPDRMGRGTWDSAIAGIEHLRAAGLSPAVLVVVGRETIELGPNALLKSLKAMGVTSAGLLIERPAHGVGPTSEPVPLEVFHTFLVELHRARRAEPGLWINVREIDELIGLLEGRPAQHCELLGSCQGAVLSVEPNGQISHCDKFLNDPSYILGNSVAEATEGPKIKSLRESDEAELRELRNCPYFHLCQGWCPHERALSRRLNNRSKGCCGLSSLFVQLAEIEQSGEVSHSVQ